MSIRLRHHLDVIKNIHTKKEIRSFVSGIYWVWYSRPYCIFLLGDATVGALCSPPPVSSGRITAGQLSCCLGAIQKPSSAQLETGFITYICLVRYLFGPCPLSQSRQSPQCAQLIMLKAFESKTRFHNNPQEPRVYLYSSHTETPPFHVVVGFLWSKHVKTTQNRLGQGGSRWSPTLTHIHTHTHTQKKKTPSYTCCFWPFSLLHRLAQGFLLQAPQKPRRQGRSTGRNRHAVGAAAGVDEAQQGLGRFLFLSC